MVMSLRCKATCHQIMQIREANDPLRIGLPKPHPASMALKTLVADLIDLHGHNFDLRSASSSRHSAHGVSSVGDIVICRQPDGLTAGRVWAHVEIIDEPWSLLQKLRRVSEDRAEGTVAWAVLDEYDFIPTSEIEDAVTWCDYGDDIRTLKPRDL